MMVRVVLVDVNRKMVAAWRESFEENPEVEIVHGSMLDQRVSAYVTPTNSAGSMDGGLDAILKNHFGAALEKRVQQEIHRLYGGSMPLGRATCVPTGRQAPAYLISTPTMSASSEDISDTLNVALACAAAFQAIHARNAAAPGSIESVALPGLGANTGRVPVEICADLMWTGYQLFRRRAFEDFDSMRQALEQELGELTPSKPSQKTSQKTSQDQTGKAPPGKAPAAPSTKTQDIDFDDSE